MSSDKNKVIEILKRNFGEDIKLDLVNLARYSYKLIPTNIKESQYIYSYIINSFPISNYKRQLNCLKNMILERKDYLKLTSEEQKQYNYFKEKAKKIYENCPLSKNYNYDTETEILLRKEKLEEAYDYYLAALYITNHNIFNYYLGKMCYKNNCIDEAREYLEEYIKNGGEKLSKALLYLNKIYKIKKLKNKSRLSSNKIKELSSFFESNFEFLDFSLEYEYYVKNNGNKDKKYIGIFEQSKISVNLKEKLEIIKNLILTHQDKKADKMLLELEREKNNMNNKDKQTLLQFQKNKKLYRAKR